MLADREPRKKLDAKSDEAIFLGYSSSGAAFRVFNKRTKCVMESRNVIVDDEDKPSEEDETGVSSEILSSVPEDVSDTEEASAVNEENSALDSTAIVKKVSSRIKKNHPSDAIIGELNEGVVTRRKEPVNYREMISNVCFTFRIEPKNVKEVASDEFWMNAMQEELVQFERNEVWKLVP